MSERGYKIRNQQGLIKIELLSTKINLPCEIRRSPETIPNPFTGMSDLFNKVDNPSTNDGIIKPYFNQCTDCDEYQPWTAEVINGQLQFTAYAAVERYC